MKHLKQSGCYRELSAHGCEQGCDDDKPNLNNTRSEVLTVVLLKNPVSLDAASFQNVNSYRQFEGVQSTFLEHFLTCECEDINYRSTRPQRPEDLNLLTSAMMRKLSTECTIENCHVIRKQTTSSTLKHTSRNKH